MVTNETLQATANTLSVLAGCTAIIMATYIQLLHKDPAPPRFVIGYLIAGILLLTSGSSLFFTSATYYYSLILAVSITFIFLLVSFFWLMQDSRLKHLSEI